MTEPSPLPLSGAHWVDHVARHAHGQPDAVALRFRGGSITWAQLQERIGALSAGLLARGVSRGDRVAILMTNRPEVIESVIAANAIGAIAVPVNFRLAPGEIAYVLENCGAGLLVTDVGLAPVAAQASAARPVPRLIVEETGAPARDEPAAGSEESYTSVLAEHRGEAPQVTIDERDVALIMYTSGTTGRPKGAMLTHLNLLMQAVSMIRTHRFFEADEVYLQNVPLFHIAGIGTMPAPLLNGTRTVIMETGAFSAAATLDTVQAEGVTSMFLVPAQWQALCADPETPARTRSLRTISWGGAPASADLLERMLEVFAHCEVVSVFGQTEMSPPCAGMSGRDALTKLGSVGRHVPTIAVRIVDEQMNDVPPGEVGEIVYRGPTLMAGYWDNPLATAESTLGGWFHSGDLVRQDSDGFLFVVDRKKDMIISGGENIYCAEVESALAAHPAISDVAIVGVPHPHWGETPLAVVVPVESAAPPELAELLDFLTGRLASYKQPTAVTYISELPRNAAGKVLKHVLRAAHQETAPRIPPS